MQLNTGNPNLIGHTRFLVNDETTTANQIWTTQQITDVLNLAYLEVATAIEQNWPGYFVFESFRDTEAGVSYYKLPAGFNRSVQLVIDQDGADLSTTVEGTGSKDYEFKPLEIFSQIRRNATSNAYVWSIESEHLVVYPTPTTVTAGVNSMRLVYEGLPQPLVADTDTPVIPAQYHEVIPVRAAISLKTSRDLDTRLLQQKNILLTREILVHAHLRVLEQRESLGTDIGTWQDTHVNRIGRITA